MDSRKIGEYLGCSPEVLDCALARQRQLASAGVNKSLGEVLLESQAVTLDALLKALHRQRLERLRRCPVFAGLSRSELEDVCGLIQERSVAAGDEFIRQEETGQSF